MYARRLLTKRGPTAHFADHYERNVCAKCIKWYQRVLGYLELNPEEYWEEQYADNQ